MPRLVRQPPSDLRRRRVLSTDRRRSDCRRPVASVDGQQVLGDLADLPVAVVEAAASRPPRPRVPRRRRGRRPPFGGWPACRRERRARPAVRPGRRWRRGRRPPPRGTAGRRARPSTGTRRASAADGRRLPALAERPRRHLDHRRVAVVEDRRQRHVGDGWRPARLPAGAPSGPRSARAAASSSSVSSSSRSSAPSAVARTAGAGSDRPARAVAGVADVAGYGHGPAPLGDAPVPRFRGRLHGTTMTDDEHPTTPDDAAERDPAAGRPSPGTARSGAPASPPSHRRPPRPCPSPAVRRPGRRAGRGRPPRVRPACGPWFVWGVGPGGGPRLVRRLADRPQLLRHPARHRPVGPALHHRPAVEGPPRGAPGPPDRRGGGPGDRSQLPDLQAAVGHGPLLGAVGDRRHRRPRELDAQGALQMSQAETAAKVAVPAPPRLHGAGDPGRERSSPARSPGPRPTAC